MKSVNRKKAVRQYDKIIKKKSKIVLSTNLNFDRYNTKLSWSAHNLNYIEKPLRGSPEGLVG